MKKINSIAMGLAALTLAACASTPNPLNAQTRDQFFVKNTKVTWNLPEKEEAIEVKKDAGDNGQRAEGRQLLEDKVINNVSQEFANSPSGPTPIDFNIAIKRYDRVGAVTGNLLGFENDRFIADVIVTDTNTGQELAVYEDIPGFKPSGGGILGAAVQLASDPDVEGLMALSFTHRLRKRFDKKK